ncbi:MAG: hypothetical protein L6V95_02930 [Candidatus Melainabacteria bacterium]|nr:MAG: hypothetical protein L6V95_02930 [Candidatus Melainabacteria bacterium]
MKIKNNQQPSFKSNVVKTQNQGMTQEQKNMACCWFDNTWSPLQSV